MKNTPVVIIPILPLLGVAFVVLRLCHVIDWSWWLVAAPFWAGLALFAGVFLGGVLIGLAALLVAATWGLFKAFVRRCQK